jgi:hypothetical protein
MCYRLPGLERERDAPYFTPPKEEEEEEDEEEEEGGPIESKWSKLPSGPRPPSE